VVVEFAEDLGGGLGVRGIEIETASRWRGNREHEEYVGSGICGGEGLP
jgi:hypothetical protein